MPKLSLQDLQRLPKTDLHVHLDGSLRIPTILDLAEQQKVKLPADTPEGLRPFVEVGEDCKSLVEYLRAFDVTLSVMQTYESLVRTSFELAEDAAQAVVGLVGDGEVAFVEIDEAFGKHPGQPSRGRGLGAIQADHRVIEVQLITAPVREHVVIVLGDQQAVEAQRRRGHKGWRRCHGRPSARSFSFRRGGLFLLHGA